MVKSKKFILAKRFHGVPNDSNVRLVEEDLPALREGEALFQAVYLSVDPYIRPFSANAEEGSTVLGEQVARCVETKNANFKKGCYILGYFGWRTHTIVTGKGENLRVSLINDEEFTKLNLSLSLALGILGMPGATAYLALVHHLKPKAGETVLVNAAAGAVGSVVGQVAKIKGCTVIGYAGTDAKCDWLRELGFDHVFNYKTEDLDKTLSEAAPNGVDVYFDNVGGDFSNKVILKHMALCSRVSCCGNISMYNVENPPHAPNIWPLMLGKRMTVRGFIVYDDFTPEEWEEGFKNLRTWISQGKLKYKETITDGFENTPKAFFGLFTGENIGKAVVKV